MNAALRILDDARRQGLRLSLNGDKLHVEPVPAAELLESLRAAKPVIMARLKLESAAAEACVSLKGYITPAALLSKLAPEDLADLESMPTDQAVRFLRAFATATVWTDMRRQGIAPPGWDKPATCKLCGPVLLWTSIDVSGCPWCWNRLHGVKIPRLLS